MKERSIYPLRSIGIGIGFGLIVLAAAAIAGRADAQTLEDALDNPVGLTFSTVTFDYETGDPLPGIEWFGQTVTTHDMVDAAEASGLPVGSFSRIDATIQGPATLSFWWKVDTANPLERLGFISQDVSFTIFDDLDWQYREVEIPCGEQVVSWYLDISDLSSGGGNSAWIDQIVVTPVPNSPDVQEGLDNAAVDFFSDDWIKAPYFGIPGAVGGMVAQSGPVAESSSSTVLFNVDGPFEISFDWGIESDPDAFNSSLDLEVDGSVRDQIYGTQFLTPRSFEYGPGNHCLTFTYNRDFTTVTDPPPDPPYDGGNEGYVDNLVITPIPPSADLADAVDVTSTVYGKNWVRQTAVTNDGVDAARVNGLAAGDSETMYVELPDDLGLLSMWVKLSTEELFGYLDIWVDGNYIGEFTGEQDWTKFEAYLDEGQDRVLWLIYSRLPNGTGSVGGNAAYIDQIEFVAGATPPIPPPPPPPPPPLFQPDLSIKARGSSSVGDNKYNTSGKRQTAGSESRLRRPFGKYKFRCQNDSLTELDRMYFFGTKSNRNFDIFYIIKVDGELFNISAEFQTGQFSTPTLQALGMAPFQVWISRKEGRRGRSQTARIRAVSESDPGKSDTVKARLKIGRR